MELRAILASPRLVASADELIEGYGLSEEQIAAARV